MPARLRLIDGEYEWTAEVAGDEVRLSRLVEGRSESARQTYVVRRDEGDQVTVDDGTDVRAAVAVLASDVAWINLGGHLFEVRLASPGRSTRSSTRDHDALSPPMSATVVRIAVKPGDRVAQGDLLVALEAMKMELPIRAPRDGIVAAVHCREGELVQPGAALVDMGDG
jgi:3-methylcrotonyl-CoA carboxylase alpha subunit